MMMGWSPPKRIGHLGSMKQFSEGEAGSLGNHNHNYNWRFIMVKNWYYSYLPATSMWISVTTCGVSVRPDEVRVVSQRFPETTPLVFRGPGAGAEFTASGLFVPWKRGGQKVVSHEFPKILQKNAARRKTIVILGAWFQMFVIFTPILGVSWSNLTNIFGSFLKPPTR